MANAVKLPTFESAITLAINGTGVTIAPDILVQHQPQFGKALTLSIPLDELSFQVGVSCLPTVVERTQLLLPAIQESAKDLFEI